MKVKLSVFVISVVLIITTFSGCGSTKQTAIKAAVMPSGASDYVKAQWKKWAIGSNIKLDWFIASASHTALKDWSQYDVLKDVVAITGVSPKVDVPSGDATEKLNIMITMNELPDIITVGYGDPIINKLISSGKVWSLDDLAKKYAPTWINELPKSLYDDTKSEADGKLYGIPGGYLLPWLLKSKDDVGAYTYNVRKDYYNALGQPDITTLDGFYQALKKFKLKYPTINGKPSIPLHLGTNGVEGMTTLMYSFGIQDYYVKPDKKTVTMNLFDPKYKEYMLFMNKLYRENLIDPEALLKDKTTSDEELATRSFMLPSYFWYLDSANNALGTDDKRYISVNPLNATGTSKVTFPGLTRLGGEFTMISKNSKNPEAAVKFLLYMTSEDGNLLMMYGRPEEHYSITNNIIKRSPLVQDEWKKDYVNFNDKTGIFQFTECFIKYLPEEGTEHPDRMKYDRPIADEYCTDNTLLTYEMTPDPSSSEGVAITKLRDMQNKEVYKVVTADTEDDAVAAYNKMLSKVDASDLKKLETYLTGRYKKNVAKFGAPKY